MITFIIKGIFRDKHRSLFPVIIVAIGVMLTVFLHCYITGFMGNMVDTNARFSTGHVKIMSRAYAENADQIPIDLALIGVDELISNLKIEFPDMIWVKRIRFGGLLDVPDEKSETKAQGAAMGLAVDLLSEKSTEIERLNIAKALIQGSLPKKRGEILISDELFSKLDLKIGDSVTLLSSTMYGSMTLQNFVVSGTIVFGVAAMDRGAMIVDITDAQAALDMTDAAGEILGYFANDIYDDEKASKLAQIFNKKFSDEHNRFSPVMQKLRDQNELASMLDYVSVMIGIFISVFVLVMSMVLWNAGLIGGLRRYGEIGVRLAIGEDKGHLYRLMIVESIFVGLIGSVFGTIIGLGFSYILQTKGLDVSEYMKDATLMMPNVLRANITTPAYFIGFIPGLIATVLGTALSGIGIYKRQTAQLFKELEV